MNKPINAVRKQSVFDHVHAVFHVSILNDREITPPDSWEDTVKVGPLIVL